MPITNAPRDKTYLSLSCWSLRGTGEVTLTGKRLRYFQSYVNNKKSHLHAEVVFFPNARQMTREITAIKFCKGSPNMVFFMEVSTTV